MVQIDAQTALDLAEKAKGICFFDIEATGLHGDYNSVLVVSVKPYRQKPTTLLVDAPGSDERIVVEARALLRRYPIWVSYFGRMFDVPMLQARLLLHGQDPLWRGPQDKRHHIDMYFHLRSMVRTSRRSQAHLAEWLGLPEKKMTVSPQEWNRVLADPAAGLAVLRRRCESDVRCLEHLYRRTRHLIGEITR